MIEISDAQLLDGIRDDNYMCYNILFHRYYDKICQYAYSILKNKEDSENVAQDLFLNIWKKRKQIEIKDSISGYLFRMAKNMSLNSLRSSGRYEGIQNLESLISSEGDILEKEEFRISLFDCIDRLPKQARKVFLLSKIEGIRQGKISEKLGISVKTIKNQIWISMQRLRKCLELKGIKS